MNKRGAYQKKAQNIANLRARHDLLESGLKAPASLPKAVIPSLTGQKAFAALSIPKLNISPMALNTMKSLAAELYMDPDGNGDKGFAYLNSLRVQLSSALEDQSKSRSTTKKAERVEDRLDQIAVRLQAVELQNIHRSKAYFDLYSKISALIKEGALEDATRLRLFNMLDSHHATFGSLFTPELPDGNGSGSVVPLRSRKEG